MIRFFKFPFIVWFVRFIKAFVLETKNKHLQIGYMSSANSSEFGLYNTIYDNVFLENVILNDFTYISNNTIIKNSKIGKFCSIGPGCKIGLGMHPTKNYVSTHPIFFSDKKQSQISFVKKSTFKESDDTFIGNDVWIGANVVILDGVKIFDGAIIAAGSIVNKDVPPYAIYGGVPAKLIKYRFNDITIQKLLRFEWWNKNNSFLKDNIKKMRDVNLLIK
jgi:acetyltransferase-like isoleucine patch superfamily enzyme